MLRLFIVVISLLSTSVWAQSKATQKLFKAIEKNNLALAQSAINEGADPNGVDEIKSPSTTTFIKAVSLARTEIVKLMLENHADVNQRKPGDLATALMVAAETDSEPIVRLLIQSGADVNLENIKQKTALQIAAHFNSLASAHSLLKSKEVDVNKGPHCALAVAARKGNLGMVLLLKRQAGVRASHPICVEEALMMATEKNHEQVLSVLRRP